MKAIFPPFQTENPRRAFSLVELLTVVAIIGVLVTVATPALSSLRGSGSVNSAVLNISLILEQARSYALANNVYVWVGFRKDTSTNPESLVVAAVSGVTGSATDIQSASTWRPLMKLRRFENMALSTPAGFSGMASSDGDLATGSGSAEFTFGPASSGGGKFDRVIEFGPKGGARVNPATISRWLQLGLVPVKGNAANDAAIQVAGLTGQVRIFRR